VEQWRAEEGDVDPRSSADRRARLAALSRAASGPIGFASEPYHHAAKRRRGKRHREYFLSMTRTAGGNEQKQELPDRERRQMRR